MHLEKGMTVADFGTGSGAYALALARAVGAEGKVYALDVQKDLLAKFRTQAHQAGVRNIEVMWVDLDALRGAKLGDHSVDAIVVANVLFQSEHKENFLREAHRILRPGGELLLIDWSDSFSGMGPYPGHVMKEGAAKELLGRAGFTHKTSFFAGSHHYGLLYTR